MSLHFSDPVMVTGATGYIASHLINDLLAAGQHVRATVRDKSRTDKYRHLMESAERHPGVLEIVEADLLKEDSFTLGMSDCGIVFHTASPFVLNVKDPQKDLVDPALKGTRNVLDSVNKTESVKRVVLTSSVVALYTDNADLSEKHKPALTEADWNTTASLDYQPYAYSKTLAEKAAWEMAEAQSRWDLLTINPAFVLGPPLAARGASTSIDFIKQILTGQLRAGAPGLNFGLVDVRDVSKAHILVAQLPEASGRHLASNEVLSMFEINNVLKEHYGKQFPFANFKLPKAMMYMVGPALGFSWKFVRRNVDVQLAFDNSYIKQDLGLEFRPIKDTLIDMVERMIELGMVTPKS